MKNKKLWIFVALVISVVILNYVFGWSQYFSSERLVEMFSKLIEENMALALLAYMVFTVVGCVVLALPGITFAIVAGLLFGPILGTLACSVSTTIGATIAFVAGRFFLKDSIKPKIEGNKLLKKWLFDESGKHELFVLMITRLVPLFPFNLQNFAYGVTDIKFSTYTLGSLLFMLPGTAMYTIGTAGVADKENRVMYILIAVLIGALVTGIGMYLKKRYVKAEEEIKVCENKDCVHCHLCQKNCVFLEKYGMDVVDVINHPELLYHCYLCGKCTQVCPVGIDGRDLVCDARRKQVKEQGNRLKETGYGMLVAEKKNYLFKNYKNAHGKSVLFPGCNFPSFYPKTTDALVELLKKEGVGVVYDCCGKPMAELGFEQREQEIQREIEAKLKDRGIEEMITLCPNCYYTLHGKIDVRVVTIYEKLKELECHEAMLKKIQPKATFLPCPDRVEQKFMHDMQPFLEAEPEIISEVQCCGLGGCAAAKEPELSKCLAENVGNKAEEVYVYCASCACNFARSGVGEVKHYLSEIVGIKESPDIKKSLLNRAKKRR